LLTGQWINAEDAVEWGLALECVADDALLATTLRSAGRMALAATDALRDIKGVMKAWERPFVHGAIRAESATHAVACERSRRTAG
jgi:enoyl-CoA hydratase/carnithine racemase